MPLTPNQLDQATLWVELSWIRLAMDLATLLLVLLAAPTRTHTPAPRTSDQPASQEVPGRI